MTADKSPTQFHVTGVTEDDCYIFALAVLNGEDKTIVEQYEAKIDQKNKHYFTPAAELYITKKLAESEATGWLEGYADGEKAGREAGYRAGYQDGRKARAKNDRKHQPKPARMFRYYDEEG